MPAAEFQNPQQLPVHERVHSIAQVAFLICLLHYISAVSAKSLMSSTLTHNIHHSAQNNRKKKVLFWKLLQEAKSQICASCTTRITDSSLLLIPMPTFAKCTNELNVEQMHFYIKIQQRSFFLKPRKKVVCHFIKKEKDGFGHP